jgi:hypothetical protein
VDGGNRTLNFLRRLRHMGLGPDFLHNCSTLASPNWPSMGYSIGGPWMVVSVFKVKQLVIRYS